ncbi:MAG: hypothetical protein LBT62_07940 [Deltaproteobacteria bacterium]|nr:hypothetical protein [Deltaproteobacteria bacterium]
MAGRTCPRRPRGAGCRVRKKSYGTCRPQGVLPRLDGNSTFDVRPFFFLLTAFFVSSITIATHHITPPAKVTSKRLRLNLKR